jgi:hypothetical protein
MTTTMQNTLLTRNRILFTHFDSYSMALLFPRWGTTLLWPAALPENATPMATAPTPPAATSPEHDSQAVKQAAVDACGLNADELEVAQDFNHWAQTPDGPVRIHLLRFTTPDAPKATMAALGGDMKPMSLLRGSAMSELALLREVYNRLVGGNG